MKKKTKQKKYKNPPPLKEQELKVEDNKKMYV